jgi:hypothetical protein
MPIHIDEVTTEVTVLDGELPLTDAQVERLVTLILGRLEQQRRATQVRLAEQGIRDSVIPRGSTRGD